mgnify:CR=1 FL=1
MEAVGRLAGGIAHDFNNLLTAILGTTGLLLESGTDARTRIDVEEIEKAAKRAARLTRQLLVFSRQQVLEPPRARSRTPWSVTSQRMLGRLIAENIELRDGTRGRSGCCTGRPGTAPAGHREPGCQRARCHAERRTRDDRNGQRRSRSSTARGAIH